MILYNFQCGHRQSYEFNIFNDRKIVGNRHYKYAQKISI